MHLKRFSYTSYYRDKLTTLVDFPLSGLDLSEHVLCTEQRGDAIYDCFAVSNHMGALGGGHCKFMLFVCASLLTPNK